MNQFFFGSAERPLYGVYHPPASPGFRNSAVLICYPIGREYMRCHRALVKLCDQLAAAGYHSMRFDYYGTGDSSGEGDDVDIDQWVENVRTAAQELRDLSGAENISFVGVRLGAALATYAASLEPSVESLLLWDPITDGRQYLKEMTKMHDDFVTDLNRFPEGTPKDTGSDSNELIGMPFPATLRSSLEKMELEAITELNAKKVAVIATEDNSVYQRSFKHLGTLAECRGYHVVSDRAAWNALSDLGAVLMPQAILRKIVALTAGDEA